jgi:hypothetical protein
MRACASGPPAIRWDGCSTTRWTPLT